jgi:hypothetical protein
MRRGEAVKVSMIDWASFPVLGKPILISGELCMVGFLLLEDERIRQPSPKIIL